MKYAVITAAFAATLFATGAVQANPDLAKAKNCLACHSVDNKMLGPAFKDVAAKYRGNKDMEAKLIEKVRNGSTGAWGSIPMPPNAVSDAEARSLVSWILSL